jgi:prepilin-type N-terminal cleavage/methylation domain-containing protein
VRSQRISKNGFSLIELLVCVGILSILLGLLLPAVQAAREASRNVSCKNNMRQLGIATALHESTFQRIPGGGWGFSWVGDSSFGAGKGQPGGWLYSLLPFLELKNIQQLSDDGTPISREDALGQMLMKPVGVFTCPSRRPPNLEPFLGVYQFRNATNPLFAFKPDVAFPNVMGPVSSSPKDVKAYQWPHKQASGVFFSGSSLRLSDIPDGLSNTYFVGEKYVRSRKAVGTLDRDFGDDQAALIGDDSDIRRWTEDPPWPDNKLDGHNHFGSRHASTWNALFGDGSVKSVHFEIDLIAHKMLGNRKDGKPIALPD